MDPSHLELDGYWKLYIAPQQDGLGEIAYKVWKVNEPLVVPTP